MAKSFTPHLGLDNLNTALLTDHTTVLHALVLSTIALVILNRPKDLGTEKAIPLRLECPVIDGLRFFYLSMGPIPDLSRRGERNPYSIETQWFLGLGKKAKQFFHVSTYLLK
jgi:hypothetical protein